MSAAIKDIPDRPLSRLDVERLLKEVGSSSKLNLSGQNLERIDLTFLQLAKAEISGARLALANLQGANLSQAKLIGAFLIEANLGGAFLNKAKLRGAILIKSYAVAADLSGADLSGADLSGADLSGADLNRARLNKSKIDKVFSLQGANLSGAYLDFSQKEFLKDKGVKGLDKTIIGQPSRSSNLTDSVVSTLKITVSNNQLLQLKETADYLGITVEDLVQANLRSMLIPPDKSFEQANDYVLAKNAELLKRLA
jgi:uncharacterized protein YjbI with pentapeptide repeats